MSDQDQYGFIMNPNTAPAKKSLVPSGGFNKKQLIIFGVVGVVLLGIIVTIAMSALNSGPSNKDHLVAVAAQQNEVIRISELAIKEARGTDARNLAQTTALSLGSDKSTLTATFKAQRVKAPKATADAENTRILTEAQQNNRFDQVYLDLVQKELVEYQEKLNTAYRTSEDSQLRETMKIQYENASTIIGVDPEV